MSEREKMEIALIAYTKKTWCKSALLGFFIGLALILLLVALTYSAIQL